MKSSVAVKLRRLTTHQQGNTPTHLRCPLRPLSQFAHSFQGRYGAYPGDKGVEIGVRHFAEIFLARHGRLELAAVAADPLRERPLDVRIAESADALRRV